MLPQTPTHVHGKILDWFLASPLLGVGCVAAAVPNAAIVGHTPVKVVVPAYQHIDLGNALKRLAAFPLEGATKADRTASEHPNSKC